MPRLPFCSTRREVRVAICRTLGYDNVDTGSIESVCAIKGRMMATGPREARLDFRLSSDLKEVIEQAAASLGQSVSDFAVSTLVRQARSVIEQANVTVLSQRDRIRFITLLDDSDARPNAALTRAAKRYKKKLG